MSTTYLLDTNICVFLLRNKFNIADAIEKVGINNCCISEITVAELLYGAACSNAPSSNTTLVKTLCKELDIIPIFDTMETYAEQKAELRRKGLLIDDFDLLIACGAMHHEMILVSDNTKHFDRLPLKLVNWVERE